MPVTRTRARAEKALALLESLPEESILAVTHGGILRMIIASVIFGKELSHREYHKLLRATVTTNTGITLIEYR